MAMLNNQRVIYFHRLDVTLPVVWFTPSEERKSGADERKHLGAAAELGWVSAAGGSASINKWGIYDGLLSIYIYNYIPISKFIIMYNYILYIYIL